MLKQCHNTLLINDVFISPKIENMKGEVVLQRELLLYCT